MVTEPMEQERAHELLAQRRAEIERQLADRTRPEDGESPEDPFDPAAAAPELQQAGVADAVAEQLHDELAAIERAEKRLAEGTYGLSVESGEPISDARLETIPWAERTAEEQARYER
jgi:DnaK suppressor protein